MEVVLKLECVSESVAELVRNAIVEIIRVINERIVRKYIIKKAMFLFTT